MYAANYRLIRIINFGLTIFDHCQNQSAHDQLTIWERGPEPHAFALLNTQRYYLGARARATCIRTTEYSKVLA